VCDHQNESGRGAFERKQGMFIRLGIAFCMCKKIRRPKERELECTHTHTHRHARTHFIAR